MAYLNTHLVNCYMPYSARAWGAPCPPTPGWLGGGSAAEAAAGETQRRGGAQAKRRGEGGDAVPRELECPISFDLMREPVIADDGTTYDRAPIEAWLRKHNTSPVTGAEMRTKRLVPNYPMRIQIQQYHAGAR